MLAQDRQIRTSLKQTELAQHKLSTAAQRTAQARTRSAGQTATAVQREGRVALAAAADVRRLNAAQVEALGAGSRLAGSAQRVAAAYRTEATAATQATGAEKTRATAVRSGTTAANQAAGSAQRVASAYRSQASAARQISTAEKGRGAATAGATRASAAGAAGAAGASAGRATRAAGLGVTVGLGVAAKQAIDFDKAMRNVNSIAQLSEGRFTSLGKSVRGLAGETAQAPKTLAEGLYTLVSSGFDAKESLTVLRSSAKAATAGLTDTETSTTAVSAVLNAYRMPAAKAAQVSDQLFQTVNLGVTSFEQLASTIGDVLPFASSLGVGLDQVGASVSTLTKAGISPAETMTRLKAVMVTLIKPNDDLSSAIKETGASSGEALIKNKGFQGALEALVGTTDGSKSAVAKLFPNIRALGGALALTGKNTRGARADLAAFANTTGATDKALSQQSKSISFQWNLLKANASALAIGVGSTLVPALGAVVAKMTSISRGKGAVGGFLSGVVRGAKGQTREKATLAPKAYDDLQAARVPAVRNLERATGRRIRTVIAAKQKPDSAAEKIGGAIRNIAGGGGRLLGRLASAAVTAGKLLVDAFKPAMPFFQNVLLPLLGGIAKGVAGGVVVAFKILVPVIKIVASVLGFLGTILKPLSPVFRALGTVIGFLVGGPLLKAIGAMTKFGKLGSIVAGAARIAYAPIRLLGGIFGKLGSLIGGAVGGAIRTLVRFPGRAFSAIKSLPGRLGSVASRGASLLIGGLGKAVSGVVGVGGRIVSGVVRTVGSLPGKMLDLGKRIVSGIINGIKSAPGAIVNAIKSIIPGPLRGAATKVLGFLGGNRRGGVIGGGRARFQDGGLVPSAVSPGELVTYGDSSWTVPGPRTAADSVNALLPSGAAVWTGHGQQMLAAGATPDVAMRTQLPHFRKGGVTGPAGRKIFGHFRSNRFTDNQSAGWVGNFYQESGLDPGAIQRGGPGRGLAQWGGGRFTALQSFARQRRTPWANMATQLDFVMRELRGPERAADRAIRSSKTLASAATAIVRKYERAGIVGDRVGPARSALRAFGGKGAADDGGGGSASLGVAKTRAGLLEDAFSQGRTLGAEGLTRGEIRQGIRGVQGARRNPLLAAIASARGSASTTSATGSRSSAGTSGATGRVGQMVSFANRAGKAHPKYVYGGGHGSFKGPYDCSGYVSAILNAGGLLNGRPMSTDGFKSWGQGGAGKQVTVGVRGSTGRQAHMMVKVGSNYFESANRRGPTGKRSGWSGVFPIKRHPRGYRRGGTIGRDTVPLGVLPTPVARRLRDDPRALDPSSPTFVGQGLRAGGLVGAPRFRPGGLVPKLSSAAIVSGGGGNLTDIDVLIGDLADERILRLRAALLRAVRRGGSAKTIKRVQSVIDLIDGELGRRVGELEAQVEQRTAGVEQSRSRFDRGLRAAGVDSSSAAGLHAAAIQNAGVDAPAAIANVADLQSALRKARKAKAGKNAIREIQDKLNAALGELDEIFVTQIELRRQLLSQIATETMTVVESLQRIYRTTDTWEGTLQRAAVTALGAQAHQEAYQQAQARGDRMGMLTHGAALSSAIADYVDLVRDAINRLVQAPLEHLQWGSGLMSAGLQRLELEQKLAGTHATGGAQRAAYITSSIVPSLQAELAQLEKQKEVYGFYGMIAELKQAYTDSAAKTNEILSAQLEAQEAIEENTAERKFGGTLGFSYGDSGMTDAMIATGNGV